MAKKGKSGKEKGKSDEKKEGEEDRLAAKEKDEKVRLMLEVLPANSC